MEEKILENLSLGQLWQSMSTMGALQLFVLVLIIVIVLFAGLIIISGRSGKILDIIISYKAKKFTSYNWPLLAIHNELIIPGEISLTKKDAQIFKELILHKIEMLRDEKVPAQEFKINFLYAKRISEEVRKIFSEIAENSVELNVVQLTYVLPKIKKSKQNTETEKYFLELRYMCKKIDKLNSWEVK